MVFRIETYEALADFWDDKKTSFLPERADRLGKPGILDRHSNQSAALAGWSGVGGARWKDLWKALVGYLAKEVWLELEGYPGLFCLVLVISDKPIGARVFHYMRQCHNSTVFLSRKFVVVWMGLENYVWNLGKRNVNSAMASSRCRWFCPLSTIFFDALLTHCPHFKTEQKQTPLHPPRIVAWQQATQPVRCLMSCGDDQLLGPQSNLCGFFNKPSSQQLCYHCFKRPKSHLSCLLFAHAHAPVDHQSEPHGTPPACDAGSDCWGPQRCSAKRRQLWSSRVKILRIGCRMGSQTSWLISKV